ncbi:MAG: lysylphosphatidylglycerol synthase transmembrane domain-containing protein [bacterium]
MTPRLKKAVKFAGFLARLTLGLGIVALLLYRIDTRTCCIDFSLTEPVTIAAGTTLTDAADPSRVFVALAGVDGGLLLETVQRKGTTAQLAGGGTLTAVSEAGIQSISWKAWRISRSGLSFLGDIIRGTLDRWPWLAGGFLLFFSGIVAITVRWKLILDTQQLELAWGRIFSISFVGVFFNSFMPGAVGGDLVRGYYTSRESDRGKTELFLTVVIDRMLGLPSLIILPLVVMALQPGFVFSNTLTRAVFLVLIAAAFVFLILFFLLFKHDLFEKLGFLRRLEQKASVGSMLKRAYSAVRLCVTHPGLVARGFGLSILGQVAGVAAGYSLIMALGEQVPFTSFFTLYLMATCVAGLPVTPGGLGLREAAMVILLSAVGVPAVTSVALSLLVYVVGLACGAVGALAFICLASPQGRAPTAGARDPARP